MTAPLTPDERGEVPENTTVPTRREVLEDALDHLDYFIFERLGNEASVQSARELRRNLRDALEGAPDVPDLLAALDAATERTEKAEAALARVEVVAKEQEMPFCDGTPDREGEAVAAAIREAMEGKP